MKYITLSLIAFYLFACQSRPKQAGNINEIPQDVATNIEQSDSLDSVYTAESINNELSFMKNHIGKYPHDIDFFNIPIIKQRLQNLTKEHFEQINNCAVESQISEFKNDYILINVCFPHECHMVFCLIFLNHTTDNISLYYRNYDKHYYLSEDGKIGIEFDGLK